MDRSSIGVIFSLEAAMDENQRHHFREFLVALKRLKGSDIQQCRTIYHRNHPVVTTLLGNTPGDENVVEMENPFPDPGIEFRGIFIIGSGEQIGADISLAFSLYPDVPLWPIASTGDTAAECFASLIAEGRISSKDRILLETGLTHLTRIRKLFGMCAM